MKLTCFFNGHWPVAAFAPWQDGFQLSRCVDCGQPMMKAAGVDWKPLPARLVRRARAHETAR